jgi:hypothetical protein
MCMLKSMSLINLAKFLVVVVVGDGGQKVGGRDEGGNRFSALCSLSSASQVYCSAQVDPHVSFTVGSLSSSPKSAVSFFFFFPILTLVYASLTWTTTIIRRPRALHHLLSALDVHIYSFTVDLEPSLPPASPW